MDSANDFMNFPFDRESLLEELQGYIMLNLSNNSANIDKIICDTQKLDLLIEEFIQGLSELNRSNTIVNTNNLDVKRFILRHVFNLLGIPTHCISYSLEQIIALKEIIEKYKFTKKEAEILKLISYNIPVKEIAEILDQSELTVNKHLQNMLIKIQDTNIEYEKSDNEKLRNPLKTIKNLISL